MLESQVVASRDAGYAGRIYLNHLFRGLMEYGAARGVKNFSALRSNLWDRLLYDLKQRFPDELGNFVFEWDGPDPVSQDVDAVMFGMHFICDERCGDWRALLRSSAIPVRESRFFTAPMNFDEIVSAAFAIASEIEGFLEY